MFRSTGLCENSGSRHNYWINYWINARLRKIVAAWR